MDRLVDTLAEAEAEFLRDTSKYVVVETLVDMLHKNRAEAEVQTLGKRLRNVKFETMGMLHSC